MLENVLAYFDLKKNNDDIITMSDDGNINVHCVMITMTTTMMIMMKMLILTIQITKIVRLFRSL